MNRFFPIVSVLILLAPFASPRSSAQTALPILTLYDADTSQMPFITAKFVAFDTIGRPLSVTAADLKMQPYERDTSFRFTLECVPPMEPPRGLSSVLAFDISSTGNTKFFPGGGGRSNFKVMQAAGAEWVRLMRRDRSECAVVSYDEHAYIDQDFTTDSSRLQKAIAALVPKGGTDHDGALLEHPVGALTVAGTGTKKRVVIFFTDGRDGSISSTVTLRAMDAGVTVYVVALGVAASPELRELADRTGGICFENVVYNTSVPQYDVMSAVRLIAYREQYGEPCVLRWKEDRLGQLQRHQYVELPVSGLRKAMSNFVYYDLLPEQIARVEVIPSGLDFGVVKPGEHKDMTVTLRTRHRAERIDSLRYSDKRYRTVSGLPATLGIGDSAVVTIRYTPTDTLMNAAEASTILFDRLVVSMKAGTKSVGDVTTTPLQFRLGSIYALGDTITVGWTGAIPQDTFILEYNSAQLDQWVLVNAAATGMQQTMRTPWTPGGSFVLRLRERAPMTIADTGKPLAVGERWIAYHDKGAEVIDGSKNIIVYDRVTAKTMDTLSLSQGTAIDAVVSPDGTQAVVVALSSPRNHLVQFDLGTGQEIRSIEIPTGAASSVKYSPDGASFIAMGDNLSRVLYSSATGEPIRTFSPGEKFDDNGFAFDRAGSMIAFSDEDGKILIYEVASGATLKTIVLARNASLLDFSADGSRLATSTTASASSGSHLVLYDVKTGKQIATDYMGGSVPQFSPDGRWILARNGRSASLYNSQTGALVRSFWGFPENTGITAFNPAGTGVLVTAGYRRRTYSITDGVIMAQTEPIAVERLERPERARPTFGPTVVGSANELTFNKLLYEPRLLLEGERYAVTGPNAEEFEIIGGDPFVDAGEYGAAELRFRPAGTGVRTATIAVETPAGVYTIELTGTGVASSLVSDVRSYNYGIVTPGSSAPHTFRITNNSDNAVNIVRVRLNGPNYDDFAVTSGGGAFTLAPDESHDVTVTFTSRSTDRTSTQLAVDYNTGDGSPLLVNLHANAEPFISEAPETVAAARIAALDPVAPNPTSGNAYLGYTLVERTSVRLALIDALGREIAMLHEGEQEPGTYAPRFDATGLVPGVYYVTLNVGTGRLIRSFVVVR